MPMKTNLFPTADTNAGAHISLQRGLEEMLKLMMKIWCKQSIAVNLFSSDDQGKMRDHQTNQDFSQFYFKISYAKTKFN